MRKGKWLDLKFIDELYMCEIDGIRLLLVLLHLSY